MRKTRFVAPLLVLSLWFGGAAATEILQSGKDFVRLSKAQPTEVAEGKVEVRELFWYGCPHCNDLEPHMQKWLQEKPDYVEFVRMPAVFKNEKGHPWRVSARAFYTAQALGVLDKVHEPMFHAIHDNNRKLYNEDALAAFFGEHGVDPEAFRKTFNSFSVETKVNRAAELTRRYRISGVPAVIVGGRYRIGASMAGSHQRLLTITEQLAIKEQSRAAGGR